MSDTLQLVVVMPSDQPDRNARPLVDLTPFELSVGNLNDNWITKLVLLIRCLLEYLYDLRVLRSFQWRSINQAVFAS